MNRYLVIAIAMLSFGCAQVDSGYVGVKTHWGKVAGENLDPGLHAINVIADHVHSMDVQTRAFTVSASSASKDLQEVTTEVTVNYSLNPAYAREVYSQFRMDYEERILKPAVLDGLKASTGHYNAEDMIERRADVKDEIKRVVTDRLSPTHTVYAVSITNFKFSDEFEHAIEAKVTATQRALEEQNKLEAVKFQASQRIAAATAEAQAIKIQAEAITQSGGKEYVNLKWVEKWNGQMPSVFTGGQGSMLMMQVPGK